MQDVKDVVYLKKLGKRIRILRKERKMTQLDLAGKMDNFAEQIGRIERGEQNASVCTLKMIASALNISMKELFDFDE
ncbi:helix-turn-helix transcriptional regulator [Fluviicola sp.]|uniref:helix-turn-helix domain-containing protein n=1 Tax=Fluviicola sp. TaxID=1917219 RepID=UPI0031E27957